MFGDDDLTNEEIVELLKKGDPPGLKRFQEDWRKEMDMHPLFMDDVPPEVLDGSLDRKQWPLLASHLDMMYDDDDDPEGCANSYREDGNEEFKKGTKEGYYKAIISYTEGIVKNCSNNKLNAQLYGNRAAAQFSLTNYRKATFDCQKAFELDSTYMKAVMRGMRCQQKLGNTKSVIDWCDKGLTIDKHCKELIEIKVKSLQKLKLEERDARKQAALEAKQSRQNKMLLEAIQERKLNLYLPDEEEESEEEHKNRLLESLKCSSHGHVHLNEENQLVWPVRFLYPEYATSDVISQFCEVNSVSEHLSYMFPPEGQSPEWDEDEKYVLNKLCVFVNTSNGMIEINKDDSLSKCLTDNNILIAAGVPTFEIFVKGSEFYNSHILGG